MRGDKGFVLALNALFLVVMMGFGGFSVDLGNWYLQSVRIQRAVDSAALAGSVYLPADFATARRVANDSLKANGMSDLPVSIEQSSAHPSMLKVKLTKTVRNNFIVVFGFSSLTMSREAIGEYRPYVPMGSPSNVLGVEPHSTNTWEKVTQIGRQSRYWLNIVGGNTPKANGDRYSGNNCSATADRCNASNPIPNSNLDYSPDGQFYVVRIPNTVTGTLEVQAFDAGFAFVNDSCTQSTLNGANAYSPAAYPNLYQSGNTNPACTGDQSTDTNQPAPNTTYELWTPDSNVGGSRKISTLQCGGVTFAGYRGNIVDKVNPGASSYDPTFTSWFRKWTPVCRLALGSTYPPGDYLLRVSTNLNSNGLNRFALRAAITNSSGVVNTVESAKVSLFAKGRLVVYARENTGDVMFYMARIQSGAAGASLSVTLFDIADAAGGASLQLLPPDDATNGGSALTAFSGCTYVPPGRTSAQTTGSGCRILNMTSADYNGRIVTLNVPIPLEYRCNDTSTEGCWTRLRLTYGAGSVQDTTSWEVSLNGQPLHLVVNE